MAVIQFRMSDKLVRTVINVYGPAAVRVATNFLMSSKAIKPSMPDM